jgi:hypothetical protein
MKQTEPTEKGCLAYGVPRAKPVVPWPTPTWGDIPVTRWRIPLRPKAVVSCCRNDAPRFQSFGQRLVLKGGRREQHNFSTGSEELRETKTLNEFFGIFWVDKRMVSSVLLCVVRCVQFSEHFGTIQQVLLLRGAQNRLFALRRTGPHRPLVFQGMDSFEAQRAPRENAFFGESVRGRFSKSLTASSSNCLKQHGMLICPSNYPGQIKKSYLCDLSDSAVKTIYCSC